MKSVVTPLLGVWLLLFPAERVHAQAVVSQRAAGSAQAARAPTPGDGAVLDVNAIDPETFRTMAFRIPEGLTPRIDGRMDDEVWARAPVSGRFIQREPRFGEPVSERTEFRVLYDDRKIYFGIWAYDSDPTGIRASELKRDSLLKKGDQIKINIDTFHDRRNAFYFSTNPLGAFKDANSIENGRVLNYDWNAVWECKTSVDGQGWFVEIAIPFSQLRFKSSPGETTWGLNVCRTIIRKNEDAYWVPFPREWNTTGFSRMSHAGLLLGLTGLKAKRRFELTPFAAPHVSRDYTAGGAKSVDAKYGFDMRMGLTSDLTADVTFHTDFAQVEADQEVVNLSRFSLFFPEKRQFFTESAGIFDYGHVAGSGAGGTADTGPGLLPLFYSRQIGLADGREVPIVVGGKVTGRAGAYSLGVLNVETGERRRDDDPSGVGVDVPRANYTVLRIKRDVLAQSSVGAIFLNKQGGVDSDANRTMGVDANLILGKSTTVTGLLAKAGSADAAGKNVAGVLDLGWRGDRANGAFTYVDVPEHFDAQVGFIQRTDIRNGKLRGAWTPRPQWKNVRQVTLQATVDYFENHAGTIESRNQAYDFSIAKQDSSNLNISFERDYDLLPVEWRFGSGVVPIGGYRWDTWKLNYGSDQSRRVYGGVNVDLGGYYGGTKRTYATNLNVLPLETLLVETTYTRNEVRLPANALYATNVLSTRVSYSLSPDLFVKTFVQYNDERRLASFNFLLWYIYRPGSDLYVVYNEGWDTTVPGLRTLRTRNRSLSVKFTYWLSR